MTSSGPRRHSILFFYELAVLERRPVVVSVFHRALSGLVEPTFSFGQSGADADESGDEFGAALATGRIDNDQVDDIAIGAPGEDNSAGAAFAFSTETWRPAHDSSVFVSAPESLFTYALSHAAIM